jgi:hypothetical protein
MAKFEFTFVVEVDALTPEDQERVGRAVTQAGALALAEVTPVNALTVSAGKNKWWRGIPPVEVYAPLEIWATAQVGE